VTLVDFGEHLVFEDVARHYLIYVASPGLPNKNVSRIVRYEQGQFKVVLSIPQEEFLDFSNYSLRTDLNRADLILKSRLEYLSIYLGSLCCVNVGVVAHSRIGSPVVFKKDDVIGLKGGLGRKKYIEGKDISRYEADWKGTFIDYEAKREFFHRPKFPELFESPKIMIRRVSGSDNTIISCYDEDNFYTNDNVIHAVLWNTRIQKLQSPGSYRIHEQVDHYELRYIAAVLNSKLLSYYFSSFLATGTLQGSYTGVYPEDARKFPIRRIEFTTPPDERAQLAQEGQRLYRRYLQNGDAAPVLTFVAARLPPTAQPSNLPTCQPSYQPDVIHDLLAFLAEQMIALHRQKQSETRAFLDWLAEYTGRPVDDWALKSSLREYYAHDWAEMQRVLRRNQRRLPNVALDVDAYKNKAAAKIQAAWQNSQETLRPLLAHIAATDSLIDRIVYRLYGLSDDEIAIVQGRQ